MHQISRSKDCFLKAPTFAFVPKHWLSGLKMPMFKLFLKLEFVENLNKTPYPFMSYMEINVNRL